METVKVSASREYDVIIGADILSDADGYIEKALGGRPRLAIITDDKVYSLHGEALESALSGFDTVKFVFKNGEASKNIRVYGEILEFLAENSITRTDAIVAFGGGVVGDIAGFAASTFLRGIRFVQIPTTLLAMVDSSVGGKTAIDLEAGKNLCGTFWQPSLVLCDWKLLSTLEDATFSDGMAEVIKYGVIRDRELFERLLMGGVREDPEAVIARCVSIKRDVVNEDERDTGVRALLNFGHTAAHGIEKLSNYEITHGRAVGAGMVIAARGAAKLGLCSPDVVEDIIKAVRLYGLTESCEFSAEGLCEISLSDKKRAGGTITLVLPEKVGSCILKKIPVEELCPFFESGLR
ncbi:MAG: 3-dehydroquinate synthase [Ruminococcaceae bacterium]|nr:3-dehydroquinate synthase [Oscillospiraceae bacterium]